jgi:dimeric dUTPase (all-alpha-NTP-PPase superfamily)
MIEQLKEMLEMQKVLDSAIYDGHGVEYDESKTYLALLDELGELNHELKPTWCWWKKTVNPLDREKVLEELVDVWHFALSIYYHNFSKVGVIKSYVKDFEEYDLMDLYPRIAHKSNKKWMLEMMLGLTHKLGFTMEDIYKAYKEKNQINFERLKNNY